MPEWEGIQDNSAECPYIWFSRVSDVDPWEPLRKVDCLALNEKAAKEGDEVETEVLIECGRAVANLKTMKMSYNFFKYRDRQLCKSNWFLLVKGGNSKNVPVPLLEPVLPLQDCIAIEQLYQKAVSSTSTLSSNKNKLQEILKEEVLLSSSKDLSSNSNSDNTKKYKVKVYGSDTTKLSMRKQEIGFFSNIGMSKGELLQRGYSSYTVEGEEEELALGPVNHLVFVIHGIGETMWSSNTNNIPSLKDEMTKLRKNIQSEQFVLWRKACEEKERLNHQKNTGSSQNNPIDIDLPQPPNRVEFIPIEWYDKIHSSQNTLMKNLNATTLKTIPVFRQIANDVVFDVLMYLSPQYCREVLEEVIQQINSHYEKFVQIHGDNGGNWDGGKVSIIGHSLGSVITWDLLTTLKQSLDITNNNNNEKASQQQQQEQQQRKRKPSYLPPLGDTPLSQVIHFQPHFTIFLGSPLGLFLSLRGPEDLTLGNTPFTLPTKYAYNIFHPSDPVAYRIEPLLVRNNEKENEQNEEEEEKILYYPKDPQVLTTQIRGMRFHYKADAIRKGVTNEITKNLIGLDNFIKKNLPAENNNNNNNYNKKSSSSSSLKIMENDGSDIVFALGGGSPRVDYALQMDITEQEYISALSAHTSYFTNDDFIHFLIERTAFD